MPRKRSTNHSTTPPNSDRIKKLLGEAAIAAKNVHLELAGNQTTRRQSGVVCLFRTPHPHRIPVVQLETYFGPHLPRLTHDTLARDGLCSQTDAGSELILNSPGQQVESLDAVTPSLFDSPVHTSTCTQLHLPKDYDPLALINAHKSLCQFLVAETRAPVELDLPCKSTPWLPSINLDDFLNQDVEAMGCLIVELYTQPMVNYAENASWTHLDRVHAARDNAKLYWDTIPSCLHRGLEMILQPFAETTVSSAEFTNRFVPSTSQLLHVLCEFPAYMSDLFIVVQSLSNLRSGTIDRILSSPAWFWGPLAVALMGEESINSSHLPSLSHLPSGVLSILHPHIQQTAQTCPWWLTDMLNTDRLLRCYATLGGTKAIRTLLLPLVLSLYQPSQLKRLALHREGQHPLGFLCSRRFLRLLHTYLGNTAFLQHMISRLMCGLLSANQTGSRRFVPVDDADEMDSAPQSIQGFVEDGRFPPLTEGELKLDNPSLFIPPWVDSVEEVGIDAASSLLEEFGDGSVDSLSHDTLIPSLIESPNEDVQSCDPSSSPHRYCSVSAVTAPFSYLTPIHPPPPPIPTTPAVASHHKQSEVAVTSDENPIVSERFVEQKQNNNPSIPPVAAATDSVMWLAKRIGPIMTTRYLVPQLLATLTVCYENEAQLSVPQSPLPKPSFMPHPVQCTNSPLTGDRVAAASLRCIEQIVSLHGSAFVLHVCVPFVQKTVHVASMACMQRQSPAQVDSVVPSSGWNERTLGQLIAGLTLLHQCIAYTPDPVLSNLLSESTLQDVLIKVIRITGRHDVAFSAGSIGRLAVLHRLIDCIYAIGLRIGFEMTRTHLTQLFQLFFALFDRVSRPRGMNDGTKKRSGTLPDHHEQMSRPTNPGSSTATLPIDSTKSDPGRVDRSVDTTSILQPRIRDELEATFTQQVARLAYIAFCRLAGGAYVDNCLYNATWIHTLIASNTSGDEKREDGSHLMPISGTTPLEPSSSEEQLKSRPMDDTLLNSRMQELNLVASSALYTDGEFHLRGSWPEVLQRAVQDTENGGSHRYHGIHVASFIGHVGKVNCIEVTGTEHCFLTAGQDKTVQLWSVADSYNPYFEHGASVQPPPTGSFPPTRTTRLNSNSSGRNSPATATIGAGAAATAIHVPPGTSGPSARLVYREHKKSVFSASYLDTYRLVASCDGQLIMWDPCTGQRLRGVSAVQTQLTAVTQCPCPHGAIYCADQSGVVYQVDPRTPLTNRITQLQFSSGASLSSLVRERPVKASATKSRKPSSNRRPFPADPLSQQLALLSSCCSQGKSRSVIPTTPSPSGVSSITPSPVSPNSTAVVRQMAACDDASSMVCGFSSGLMTQVDLRQFMVVQAWQGHSDGITELQALKPGWFASSSDRSFQLWHLHNALKSIRPVDHLATHLLNRANSPHSDATTRQPGLQSISAFTQSPDNVLILCGPACSTPGSLSAPSGAAVEIVSGPQLGTSASLNVSSNNSSAVSSSTGGSGGDWLGMYGDSTHGGGGGGVGKPDYTPLGRIPVSSMNGGRVTTMTGLAQTSMLLLGGSNGSLSLMY